MIRIFLPLLLAALGLAAASCSQSEAPFAPTEAPASPQPTPHSAAAAAMPSPLDPPPAAQASQAPASQPQASKPQASQTPASQPDASQSPADAGSDASSDASPDAAMPAERRASTLIGMQVVSAEGSPVGEVKDIIFDRQGRATHLVIEYPSQPATGAGAGSDDGKLTPSPDGKLTAIPWDAALASMKEGRLVLDGSKLQDAPSFTSDAWPNLDDPSWSAAADAYWRKAVRAAIAAHPGNPIDSTTRQRGRRARDNDDGDGN